MAQTKINLTAAFFRNIRGDYQISAQILIAYHFRKYLIKKKKQIALEASLRTVKVNIVEKNKATGGNPNMTKKPQVGSVRRPTVPLK